MINLSLIPPTGNAVHKPAGGFEGLSGGRIPRRLLIAAFFLIVSVNRASAQTASEPAETVTKPALPSAGETSTAPDAATQSIFDLLDPDVIYLQNAKGDLVPVPRTGSLEQWLLSLEQDSEPSDATPPPAVARIEIAGTADDERAQLTVKLLIRNVQAEGFVRVPLALHEAIIRDELHEGPGDFQWDKRYRSDGCTWMLSGAGDHLVTLQLIVPVKRLSGTQRRLQLTLPDATSSSLKLTTTFSKLQAKSATGEPQSMNLTDRPIEILGLGARLDVTWQPVLEESPLPPVLEAETKILAHAAPEKLLIEAFQWVQVKGTVSELTVQLPDGAEAIEGGGRDYRAHQILPDNPSRVLVQLNGPNTSQVQLKWTLRLPAAERKRFHLDGFLVEQARKQSAQIGLISTDGLRMTVSQADHPNLFFISPNDFQAQTLTPSKISRAYRFLRSPFRIAIGVETIEPYFTSEPRFTLDASLNELTLEGRFALNVLRGKLLAVEFDWPNWKADGWQLESFEPQGELVLGIEPEVENQPGRLRLKLSEDHPEHFVLRLKARRDIRPGESVPLSLPRLIALDGPSARLTINEAENMTCEVSSVGETVYELDAADPGEPASDDATHGVGKARSYRIRSTEQLFTVRAIRQERRLQVASLTALELSGSHLTGVQSFHFDVQHERLGQTRLAAPESWSQGGLQFQIDGGRKITPQWQAAGADGLATATLVFPEPRLGQFSIQALFDVRLSEAVLSGEAPVEVPIFACPDHPIRQFELEMNASSESDLTVVDANWKPRTGQSGRLRWVAEGPVSSARVQCEAGQPGSHPMLVTAADVRASWDRQGTCRATAEYRVSGAFARVQFVLPIDSQLESVDWDRRRLRLTENLISENQPRQYSVRVRAEHRDAESHSLTISYTLPAIQVCGLWNQWSLPVPLIPQARWLAEGRWRIHFPSDQHLFSYSSAVTPRFQWQRTGVVWSRVSPPSEGSAPETAASQMDSNGSGNEYAFRQFGELKELRFSTMSGAMILFVGASISLAVGFLVLRVAALRHLMTLWAGVFAIALAGLAFRSQLEILLQPIVIGFIFPLIAVWMQGLRRQASPVISFDPLMDLVETESSVTRSHAPARAGGQEPVLMRSPTGSTHDFLRTEAGSGVS